MREHGKKYNNAAKSRDIATPYQPKQALEIVKQSAFAKFDETVEVAVRLGVEGKISLAVVADLLGSPDRGSMVFRAGFVGSAALSDHVEVIGSLIPPIISPDTLGVAQGDFAQLGVRYRWATGSAPDEREATPLP